MGCGDSKETDMVPPMHIPNEKANNQRESIQQENEDGDIDSHLHGQNVVIPPLTYRNSFIWDEDGVVDVKERESKFVEPAIDKRENIQDNVEELADAFDEDVIIKEHARTEQASGGLKELNEETIDGEEEDEEESENKKQMEVNSMVLDMRKYNYILRTDDEVEMGIEDLQKMEINLRKMNQMLKEVYQTEMDNDELDQLVDDLKKINQMKIHKRMIKERQERMKALEEQLGLDREIVIKKAIEEKWKEMKAQEKKQMEQIMKEQRSLLENMEQPTLRDKSFTQEGEEQECMEKVSVELEPPIIQVQGKLIDVNVLHTLTDVVQFHSLESQVCEVLEKPIGALQMQTIEIENNTKETQVQGVQVDVVTVELEDIPRIQAGKLEDIPRIQAGKLEDIPEIQAGKLEDIPEIQAEKLEDIPEIQAGKLEDILDIQEVELEDILATQVVKLEDIPEIPVGKLEDIPEIQIGEMEDIPATQVVDLEDIPEIQVGKLEDIPETQAGKLEDIPEIQAVELEDIPETQAVELRDK